MRADTSCQATEQAGLSFPELSNWQEEGGGGRGVLSCHLMRTEKVDYIVPESVGTWGSSCVASGSSCSSSSRVSAA